MPKKPAKVSKLRAKKTEPEQSSNLYEGLVPLARLKDKDIYRHVISVIVDNEAGVLARVIGLIAGRGYNIESLTVAEVDRARQISRINIATSGTHQVIEQVKAQLGRLVPVHVVRDLTDDGPSVARELALVKVGGVGEKRVEACGLATSFAPTWSTRAFSHLCSKWSAPRKRLMHSSS